MSDDLTAWFRAQLDEDERKARAAAADYAGESGLRWRVDTDSNVRPADAVDNSAVAVGSYGGGIDAATAEHIVDHDPARVLREVEAKRRILDLHQRYPVPQRMAHGEIHACTECGDVDDSPTEWPCDTVRLLALPYADRSGYRDDWRP